MGIVALTSASGSPGVTSTAYGLAVALGRRSGRPPLLIEADPSGGSMALRFNLKGERSLATFAGTASRGIESGMLNDHTQDVSGVACLTIPSDPLLARWALSRSSAMLAEAMIADQQLTVVDLGRFAADSPSLPFAQAADRVLVIAQPTAEDIQSMLFAVRSLRQSGCTVGLVCLGQRPFSPVEVADLAGIPLVAVLPDDRTVAAALRGGAHSQLRFRRSSLWRSLSQLGALLLGEMDRPQVRPSSNETDNSWAPPDPDGRVNTTQFELPAPTGINQPKSGKKLRRKVKVR